MAAVHRVLFIARGTVGGRAKRRAIRRLLGRCAPRNDGSIISSVTLCGTDATCRSEARIYVFLLIGWFAAERTFPRPAQSCYPHLSVTKTSCPQRAYRECADEELDSGNFASQLSKAPKSLFQTVTIGWAAWEYLRQFNALRIAPPRVAHQPDARKTHVPSGFLRDANCRSVRKCYFLKASGSSREIRNGRYSSSSRMRT